MGLTVEVAVATSEAFELLLGWTEGEGSSPVRRSAVGE